ncbi:MAG: hypothetical protein ACPGJV_10555, partial [Bacteriovoracaceae bacterium]
DIFCAPSGQMIPFRNQIKLQKTKVNKSPSGHFLRAKRTDDSVQESDKTPKHRIKNLPPYTSFTLPKI